MGVQALRVLPAATSCRSGPTATTRSISRRIRRPPRRHRARASAVRAAGAAARCCTRGSIRTTTLATQTGMVSGTVTNMMTGKGRFQIQYAGEMLDRRGDARLGRRAQGHRQRLRPERRVHELRIPDEHAAAGRRQLHCSRTARSTKSTSATRPEPPCSPSREAGRAAACWQRLHLRADRRAAWASRRTRCAATSRTPTASSTCTPRPRP